MKFGIGAFISAVWLFSASAAGAETVKVGVLPNVYAQSIEALIPESQGAGAGDPNRRVHRLDHAKPCPPVRRHRRQLLST
jgi:hypothetical protein